MQARVGDVLTARGRLAEAGRLGAVHATHPGILSLYLTIPLDLGELRGLPTRADDLIAAAESAAGDFGPVAQEDRRWVRAKLETGGRDWLGRTVAMFAGANAGLSEALLLPCHAPDRAVLGIRPHIRPLLATVQRCPAYWVAVVDRRHARLFHVDGEETETVTAPVAATVPSPGFGGWYGLESYRVQQRAAQLTRHHYHDTAVMLEKAMAEGETEPLVIGGHDVGTRQLLASLPPGVQERFAGSFAADTHTLTTTRVRELAAPLVARWAGQRAERLAEQVVAPPGGHAAIGLSACLAAVNACAVHTLIVPDDGFVLGFQCGRCGGLSVEADKCPDWGAAALRVPDVIEEMVTRTLEDGGQVCPVQDGLSRIEARLRFRVAR